MTEEDKRSMKILKSYQKSPHTNKETIDITINRWHLIAEIATSFFCVI